MRVAVTSTVVFDVPEMPLDKLRAQFYEANAVAIGKPHVTVTGVPWLMRAIESLEVERRDQ